MTNISTHKHTLQILVHYLPLDSGHPDTLPTLYALEGAVRDVLKVVQANQVTPLEFPPQENTRLNREED